MNSKGHACVIYIYIPLPPSHLIIKDKEITCIQVDVTDKHASKGVYFDERLSNAMEDVAQSVMNMQKGSCWVEGGGGLH